MAKYKLAKPGKKKSQAQPDNVGMFSCLMLLILAAVLVSALLWFAIAG